MEITPELVRDRPDLQKYQGRKLPVIAWLWARTVRSPNPAFSDVEVPLASTFVLSTKKGKEAWVEPVVEGRGYRFTVRVGTPPPEAKTGTKLNRGNFRCLLSNTPIRYEHVDSEANSGWMGSTLMAVVAQGNRGRVYLTPSAMMEDIASGAKPSWKPDLASRGTWASNAQGRRYGFWTFGDYFTPRQLVALTTFSDLVGTARRRVHRDAAAGLPDDCRPLREGGTGAAAYAEAVGLYLAFAVDKAINYGSTICTWDSSKEKIRSTFAKQAIPMAWDFAESDTVSQTSLSGVDLIGRCLERGSLSGSGGQGTFSDSRAQDISAGKLVSTDPPYYDNIAYADLSDFFYVWLRRSLRTVFPDLFGTMAVPKAEELVATPYRHGSKKAAESFFLDGMSQAMRRIAGQAHPIFPVTIYYAFKQSETKADGGVTRTGWETFLDAAIDSGFAITATWPMRTELSNKIGMGANLLASSIVLACRRRPADAPAATRRDFLAALRAELPTDLQRLRSGNIAPVDLAQAAIGPGMAVFTRYTRVLHASGERLTVGEALVLINEILDEVLAEQEGDFDTDTRWALAWFAQHGFEDGRFGDADILSKAKNNSVEGLVEAGILHSRDGRVRLLRPDELSKDAAPVNDRQPGTWEIVHRLIRELEAGGETAAGDLLRRIGGEAATARELAYNLFTLSERKRLASEARSYNALVISWPEIARLAGDRKGAARKLPMTPSG